VHSRTKSAAHAASPAAVAGLVAAIGLLLSGPTGEAQALTWQRNLGQPLVEAVDGKMVIDQVSLCRFQKPGAEPSERRYFHLRVYSEAPDGAFISPDNFVAVTVSLTTRIVLGLAERVPDVSPLQAFRALRCKGVSSPLGEIEHELRYEMKPEGIEVKRTNRLTGERIREVMKWSDLYPE
jgi:hypothetical protein